MKAFDGSPTVIRILALFQAAVLLGACASKPSYIPGVYASTDFRIDAPNPIMALRPRYFDLLDERHIVVYYPVRTNRADAHKGNRFVWASQLWSLARISDQPSGGSGIPACCYYRASVGRASKGMIWLFHFPSGDNLAWFTGGGRVRHDYLRVARALPLPGSPYSFATRLLEVRI